MSAAHPWIFVFCRGGEASGYNYATLTEPPDDLRLIPHPTRDSEWRRVAPEFMDTRRYPTPWPGEVVYTRDPRAEWRAGERIYYQKESTNGTDRSPHTVQDRSGNDPRNRGADC